MKKNIMLIVMVILLTLSVEAIADTIISSESISYSNNKTAETTVNGALNELFSAVDLNEEVEEIKNIVSNLQTKIDNMYPVGSIYITEKNENPSTIFGGTWERYGVGKTLLSTDGTSGQTGGSNTASLSTSNLPSHTHSIPALSGNTNETGAHTHAQSVATGNVNSNQFGNRGEAGLTGSLGGTTVTQSSGSHKHTITTTASTTGATGSGESFSVQNPYITVYMWKRTA